MAALEIIGIPQSTYVRVVRIACAEKGVDYALHPAMPHSDEVNALHPLGKVPAMRHGDVRLCESKAICTYIDRSFDGPALTPADPVKAGETEQWVSLVNTAIDPVMIRQYLLAYIFPKGADGKPDRQAIDAALPTMERQIALLDSAVAATGHLVGDSFTLADMNLIPILHYIKQTPEGGAMLKNAPNLSAYFERHSQRPSVKDTVPPPPPSQ
jgi:glutathione S-transferase